MTKTDLINAIANSANISKKAAAEVLDATLETIVTAIAAGDSVSLVGFGAFKAQHRSARIGKNPKTGEPVQIPEATVPKFSPGATFKAAVARK